MGHDAAVASGRAWGAAGAAAVACLTALGLNGCGDDDNGTRAAGAPDLRGVDVTVGWIGDDDTDALLGELYAQALKARGATVERRPGLDDRQTALQELEADEVTVVPERSHALLADLTAPAEPEAMPTSEQLLALRDALPAGLTVLTPSSAHDSESVACRQAVVEQYELTTRTDLEQLVADRPGDLAEDDCRTLAASDPAIARDHLLPLVDDQLDTPIEAVVPLVRTSAVTPELQATLDALSSTLEPETLPALLAQVRFDGDDVSAVVRDWLETVDIT
jgi:osmoprotectant transport system substrate-binding protein